MFLVGLCQVLLLPENGFLVCHRKRIQGRTKFIREGLYALKKGEWAGLREQQLPQKNKEA